MLLSERKSNVGDTLYCPRLCLTADFNNAVGYQALQNNTFIFYPFQARDRATRT